MVMVAVVVYCMVVIVRLHVCAMVKPTQKIPTEYQEKPG